MAYIGSPVQQVLSRPPTSQSFNGDGSTTVFTLNRSVNVSEELEVFVSNVQQEPGVGKSYTANGTSLTFDEAPPSGTGNIYVIYRGLSEVTRVLEHHPNNPLAATTGTFSGNVGIGTTSPGGKLTVYSPISTTYANGNTNITNSLFNITNTYTTSTANAQANMQLGIYDGTYNRVTGIAAVAESATNRKASLAFWTDDSGSRTEKLRITGDGNVGIGRIPSTYSSPGVALEIGDGHSILGYSDNLHLSNNAYYNSGWYRNFTGTATNLLSVSGQWIFRNSGSDSSGTGISWTNRLVIEAGGNVGIGTSSPNEKVTSSNGFLSIGAVSTTVRDGAIVDYSGTISRFIAGRAGGNYGQWEAHVAGASGVTKRYQIDYDSTNRWYAANGTTERMRIDSSGNVGIGTSSPAQLLHVNNSGGDAAVQIQGNTRSFKIEQNNYGLRFVDVDAGSAERMRIDASGVADIPVRLKVGSANANPTTGAYGLRLRRSIINWFSYGANDGHNYLHIKTNLVNSGANPQPTMSLFHIKGYTYSAESIDSMLGFHNWVGYFYNTVYTNNGSRTVVSSSYPPYVSSDGYSVLVINIGNNYPGITIDYHQAYQYGFLDVSILAYSKSASTSGVY